MIDVKTSLDSAKVAKMVTAKMTTPKQQRAKTTAEAVNEVNKAFRELAEAIVAVFIKTADDINRAWKKGKK